MIQLLNIEDQRLIKEMAEQIDCKMEWVSQNSSEKIPYTTIDGKHDDKRVQKNGSLDDGINWWTNGFWAGMLWLLYRRTGKEDYKVLARKTEGWLDEAFDRFEGLHHDVGFMWLPSAVADYRITNDQDAKRRALHAATILAGRFNPVGQFIRAWNDLPNQDTRGWVIIDSMFNIPLLYWAYEETKDPRFQQIAMMHADTVQENFIREDGSVNHIVEFDPVHGGKVCSHGGQGYDENSSWTRGQTWALYGFAISYARTGKEEYLQTAKKVAAYVMKNIPEDGIIPVDFRQPTSPRWEDSCAAAIAASGLIEIAKYVPEKEKQMYLQPACKLLRTLYEKRCDFSDSQECILNNCTAAYHCKIHHQNIIYGDYFLMEAVYKLLGETYLMW